MTPTRSRIATSHGDEGIGMILVIGIAAIVFGMVATALTISMNSLSQSRGRTNFEMALASAEAGLDQTLARVQTAYDDGTGVNGDFPVPGTQVGTSCNATPVSPPTAAETATPAAELAWVRGKLEALRAAHPGCVVTTASGQYLVLKPQGTSRAFGRVYALGSSPGFGQSETVERLIKVEYIFMPYAPSNAILAAGDLAISSSTTVTTVTTNPPTAATLAGVHANGTITTQGNPSVTGLVSSTQPSSANSNRFSANPGGAVTQTPTVHIPRVNAVSFYRNAPVQDAFAVSTSGWWHDLCPDNTIRVYSSNGPCDASAAQYEGMTGVSYNATSHTWTIDRNAPIGVYFAHQANVTNGNGNRSFANLTVIASAENNGDCEQKRYGNIDWKLQDIAVPAVNNLFMYADADLMISSNFHAGNSGANGSAVVSGMFVAGDQIDLETSSQGAVGSVLSADQCQNSALAQTNTVKNPAVYFDPNAKSPFTSIINQTLWLEL